MTVCDIRSDSFSITTSAAAWCEQSAFVSTKTPPLPPPPPNNWQRRSQIGEGKKEGKKEEERKKDLQRGIGRTFFSSWSAVVARHTGRCHISGTKRNCKGGRFLHNSKKIQPVRLCHVTFPSEQAAEGRLGGWRSVVCEGKGWGGGAHFSGKGKGVLLV